MLDLGQVSEAAALQSASLSGGEGCPSDAIRGGRAALAEGRRWHEEQGQTAQQAAGQAQPPLPPAGPGLTRVLAYMDRIKPSEEDLRCSAPLPTEERDHLTEAPTLLPTIIFQARLISHAHAVPPLAPARRQG